MPKNIVDDPATDREIHYAQLLMSGTMTDRQAAEAAGLNPGTAAYTKSKPRVRACMEEHRAAVAARLVDLEVEAVRRRNRGRDQILARLWELANLSPEATRGSIAGQMKAMAMIVAIEGLIPDRRRPQPQVQPAGPLAKPSDGYQKQEQAEGMDPDDVVIATEVQPAPPGAPKQEPAPRPATNPAITALLRSTENPSSVFNPFIDPGKGSREPDAITRNFLDVARHTPDIHLLVFPPETGIAPIRY
jgi:hypothetical protein